MFGKKQRPKNVVYPAFASGGDVIRNGKLGNKPLIS
jgi:hypothetical protein